MVIARSTEEMPSVSEEEVGDNGVGGYGAEAAVAALVRALRCFEAFPMVVEADGVVRLRWR